MPQSKFALTLSLTADADASRQNRARTEQAESSYPDWIRAGLNGILVERVRLGVRG